MKYSSILAIVLASFCLLFNIVSTKSFPRVRLFNPKEGDIWFTGETRRIFWRKASIPPPPDPPTVNITLRRANHELSVPIARNWPTDNLKFQWKIPGWLPNGDDYRIYIVPNRAYPRTGTPNIMASKSKPFTIVRARGNDDELLVKSPVTGDVWFGGQYRFIRWSFPTAKPEAKVSIFVEDTENGYIGVPYPYRIASDLPVSSKGVSGYRWQIPFAFRTSNGYQIRVVAEYNDGRTQPIVGYSSEFTVIQIGDASQQKPTPLPDIDLDNVPETDDY